MMTDGYWFKSAKFEIEPGEDEAINPRMYGRQLAAWLKDRLAERGYRVEEVCDEDWGRCITCAREPFWLWVGCGNSPDYDTAKPGDGPPSKEDVMWHCFAVAEAFFLRRWFSKVDTGPALSKLDADLASILSSEPQITLVAQP